MKHTHANKDGGNAPGNEPQDAAGLRPGPFRRALRWVQRATRALFILPVRLYKRFLSPLLPASCRYYPSCSSYMMEAIEKRGVFIGLGLGIWRLLRCNPWSKGGYDPVPMGQKHRCQHPAHPPDQDEGSDCGTNCK